MEITSNLTRKVFQEVLKKDYDMSSFDYETFIGLGAECLESREIYQKVIGKFADALETVYGNKALEKYSDDLEDATGLKISVNSIRNYRWIYRKVGKLKMPIDFSFSVWQALAGTDNPKEWIDKAIKEGWSGMQLRREIKLFKGIEPKKQLVKCPQCAHEFQI